MKAVTVGEMISQLSKYPLDAPFEVSVVDFTGKKTVNHSLTPVAFVEAGDDVLVSRQNGTDVRIRIVIQG